MSRDAVFDKSASWYEPDSTPSGPTEEELDVNMDDDIQPRPLSSEIPSSNTMSGPQEPPRTENIPRPKVGLDKGKSKMPQYEDDHPENSDLDVTAPSIDSEFGIPIMRTPGVKKVLTSTN